MGKIVAHHDYFTVNVVEINAGWLVEVVGPDIDRVVPLLLGASDVRRFMGVIKTAKLSGVPFETAFMTVAGAAKIALIGPMGG